MSRRRMRNRRGSGGRRNLFDFQYEAQEAAMIYHSVIFPNIQEEIQQVENRVTREHGAFSEVEVYGWLPDPGDSRGRRIQYMNAITFYWQVKTLLGLFLQEKPKESHEIISFVNGIRRERVHQISFILNEIRRQQVHQISIWERRMDARLVRLETHLQCHGCKSAAPAAHFKSSPPAGMSAPNEIIYLLNEIRRVQQHQISILERMNARLAHLETHECKSSGMTAPVMTSSDS